MRVGSLIFIAMYGLSVTSCGTPEPAQSSACDVAKAFSEMVIADMADRQIAFSSEPFDPSMDLDEMFPGIRDPLTAAARPPLPLLDRFRGHGPTDAVAQCDTVRTLLQDRSIPFGRRAAQQELRQDADGSFASTIVGVSYPAISDDERSALIGFTISTGTLDEAGFLLLMEKQPSNRWQVVAEYRLYVS